MKNPPLAARWLSQIEGARSSVDVVRVMRAYLATLATENRARFLPGRDIESISSASDVQELAVTLAHLDLKASQSPDSAALHEAAVVFAAAGSRLAKVSG